MLQPARTKRLHWWLMETRVVCVDQNGRQIQKTRSEITCAWHFKYAVVVVEWWTLSCIEIRSLSSPPNPFLKPKYVKRRRKISKPEQAFLQSYFHWFFTEVLDQLTNADLFLHGTMPLILINYHPLLLTGLSLLFIPVGLAPWMSLCLSQIHKNETILNSVCPSKLPQSATTLEHQYCGFPVGRVARHAVQEIRSDQVTCLYTALWITINYTVASTI